MIWNSGQPFLTPLAAEVMTELRDNLRRGHPRRVQAQIGLVETKQVNHHERPWQLQGGQRVNAGVNTLVKGGDFSGRELRHSLLYPNCPGGS